MNLKNSFYLIIVTFLAFFSVSLSEKIFAQVNDLSGIQYPVKELGSCKDKADCKIYCDDQKNIKVCLAFAKKNNLMSQQEVSMAEKFIAASMKGPGGCKADSECKTYCDNADHLEECIAFAEKNDLLPAQELAEAKQAQAAIKNGAKPPACVGKKNCDAYCNSTHAEECVAFAEAIGSLKGQELENAKKMAAALKKGVKPLPCENKESCDKYCSNPDNMEVCVNFASEAGLMNEQEKTNSQKMLAALKKGIKPLSCGNKDQCSEYCSQEEHFEECTKFSEEAGFMTSEEAAMARKTGGKGPGDCKSKEECESFCNNPDNQETCFNFANDRGMIPEEDLKRMEEGKRQMKSSLGQAPQVVLDCLTTELGVESLDKLRNGTIMPAKDIGEKMRTCFEKIGPENIVPGEPGSGGMIPPAGQTLRQAQDLAGPGGCKGKDECESYCKDHLEECAQFQPASQDLMKPGDRVPQGDMMGSQAQSSQSSGPGGCQNQEECKKYCENNPEECKNFNQPKNINNLNSANNINFGQGVNTPNQGQRLDQEGGQGDSNPAKCIDDCESTGKNCISALATETKACLSKGQYCRQVTCETVDAEGNRSTAEVMRQCYASKCDQLETSCHDIITAKDSVCRTTKDNCITQCQKTSKPTKPTLPTQLIKPSQPDQSSRPTSFDQLPQQGQSGQNRPAQGSNIQQPTQSGPLNQPIPLQLKDRPSIAPSMPNQLAPSAGESNYAPNQNLGEIPNPPIGPQPPQGPSTGSGLNPMGPQPPQGFGGGQAPRLDSEQTVQTSPQNEGMGL
jgi:intracellular sulfur oxidation DsrE/DsrF family protein